jgi:hypothetical protein
MAMAKPITTFMFERMLFVRLRRPVDAAAPLPGHSEMLGVRETTARLSHAMAYAVRHLAYPADRPLGPLVRPDRRLFDEVVHWDRWQSSALA